MVKYILGDTMNEHFVLLLRNLDLTLSERQIEQFERYFTILIDSNSKLNLTSITEKDEVFTKHFYDSLCLIKAYPMTNQTILDVGSGAGFPSIPLKIVYPNLQVTILDALHKRIKFLEHLTTELGLDVELIHGRAEEYTMKNHYDLVTARAVANLRILSELCIPFVRPEGYFLGMKGPSYEEELEQSGNTITLLGGKLEKVVKYEIEEYNRTIIVVKKQNNTNIKYPRKYNKIKSKPL